MTKRNICKRCRYWQRTRNVSPEAVIYKDEAYGSCDSGKFVESYTNIGTDSVSYWSLDYYSLKEGGHGAVLVTGEDFGCVHFTRDK